MLNVFANLFNSHSVRSTSVSSGDVSPLPVAAFVEKRCVDSGIFNDTAVNELRDFAKEYQDSMTNQFVCCASSNMDRVVAVTFLLNLKVTVAATAGGNHIIPMITPVMVRVPVTYRTSTPPTTVTVSLNVPPAQRSQGASGALNPQATFIDASSYEVRVPQGSSTIVGYIKELAQRCARTPPVPGMDPNCCTPLPFTATVTLDITPQNAAQLLQQVATRQSIQATIAPGPSTNAWTCTVVTVCNVGSSPCTVQCAVEFNSVSDARVVRARLTPINDTWRVRVVQEGGPCSIDGYLASIDATAFQENVRASMRAGSTSWAGTVLNELTARVGVAYPFVRQSVTVEAAKQVYEPQPAPVTSAVMPSASPPQQQQQSQSDDDSACVICLDARREYVCVPCGHRVLCEACKARFPPKTPCPTCRTPIEMTMKVFL